MAGTERAQGLAPGDVLGPKSNPGGKTMAVVLGRFLTGSGKPFPIPRERERERERERARRKERERESERVRE